MNPVRGVAQPSLSTCGEGREGGREGGRGEGGREGEREGGGGERGGGREGERGVTVVPSPAHNQLVEEVWWIVPNFFQVTATKETMVLTCSHCVSSLVIFSLGSLAASDFTSSTFSCGTSSSITLVVAEGGTMP